MPLAGQLLATAFVAACVAVFFVRFPPPVDVPGWSEYVAMGLAAVSVGCLLAAIWVTQ